MQCLSTAVNAFKCFTYIAEVYVLFSSNAENILEWTTVDVCGFEAGRKPAACGDGESIDVMDIAAIMYTTDVACIANAAVGAVV